jgi:hypothetical protein
LTSKAGQSFTGVVTALLSAATPLEMAEESRFLATIRHWAKNPMKTGVSARLLP